MGSRTEKTSREEELVGPVLRWLEEPHSAPTMAAMMEV